MVSIADHEAGRQTYLLLIVKLLRTRLSVTRRKKASHRTHHHLLNHSPRLSIQVAQLGILGRELGGVDTWMVCQNVWPPLRCRCSCAFMNGQHFPMWLEVGLPQFFEFDVQYAVVCRTISKDPCTIQEHVPILHVESSSLISANNSPSRMGSG